jgi:hypothetical protein
MIKINRHHFVRLLLLATTLPFGLLAADAMSAHAGTVTITGANGATGAPGKPGGAGATATATSSDPSNSATAIGGNGGPGGPGRMYYYPPGPGGVGGAASSTATASSANGSASATATSTGGNGGLGGPPIYPCHVSCFGGRGGNGGPATSSATASSTTGSGSATANSTGGVGAFWGSVGGTGVCEERRKELEWGSDYDSLRSGGRREDIAERPDRGWGRLCEPRSRQHYAGSGRFQRDPCSGRLRRRRDVRRRFERTAPI